MRRRRLTARGLQPRGPLPHGFAWCSVSGAVAPLTEARFCLALPALPAALVPRCSDAWAEACPASLTRLRLDHRRAHTAERLSRPTNGRLVCLPPDGPELNPIARVWRDRNEALAGRHVAPLEGPQEDGAERLRTSEHATRHARTGDPSLVEALHARCA
jgi:hypothetical protein